MGTFTIKPTSLVSGGIPFTNSGSITIPGWYDTIDANTLLQCLLDPTDVNQLQVGATAISAFSDTIKFGCSGPSIYLDGSITPIDFNHLPGGFTATSAIIKVDLLAIQNPDSGPPTQYNLLRTGGIGTVNVTSYLYDFTGFPKPLMLDIVNNGMGISVILNSQALTGGAAIVFGYLRIEGTYTIVNSQFTLQTTTPVYVGDKIKLTGAAPNNVLDGVAQITLTTPAGLTVTVPSYDIIVQQPGQLWFYVPSGFYSANQDQSPLPVTITLIGNGKQFSGSVAAGVITILFADASGIYILSKTQTNDILYSRFGYTTDSNVLMIPDLSLMETDEATYDDFYDLLGYPKQIMTQNDISDENENFESDYFSVTPSSRLVATLINVEIPSPFIETAFLP